MTFANRTNKAPWAGRSGHTSVIDAAGAIYVIGGEGDTNFNDVWVSTDGGAPDRTRPLPGGGVLGGCSGSTRKELEGSSGGTCDYSGSTRGY